MVYGGARPYNPAYAGILQVSNAAAVRAGFEYRSLAETIRSILDWAAESPAHVVAGLPAAREAELLGDLSRAESALGG